MTVGKSFFSAGKAVGLTSCIHSSHQEFFFDDFVFLVVFIALSVVGAYLLL